MQEKSTRCTSDFSSDLLSSDPSFSGSFLVTSAAVSSTVSASLTGVLTISFVISVSGDLTGDSVAVSMISLVLIGDSFTASVTSGATLIEKKKLMNNGSRSVTRMYH